MNKCYKGLGLFLIVTLIVSRKSVCDVYNFGRGFYLSFSLLHSLGEFNWYETKDTSF